MEKGGVVREGMRKWKMKGEREEREGKEYGRES